MSNLESNVTPRELFERFGMDGRKPLWNYEEEDAEKCPTCGKLTRVSKVEGISIKACGCKKAIK